MNLKIRNLFLCLAAALIFGCSGDDDLPQVTTLAAEDVEGTPGSVILKGQLESADGVSAVKFYYNLDRQVSISKWQSKEVTPVSLDFSAVVSNLDQCKRYYVRAAATNADGEGLGDVVNVRVRNYNKFGSFTDSRDNRTYKTVTIDDQTWLAENFAYLPSVYPPKNLSSNLNRYYVYSIGSTDLAAAKATDYYKNLGVLYNWPAANASIPEGWHLPTKAEWNKLFNTISEDFAIEQNDSTAFADIAKYLKNIGFDNGLNFYGLTVQPSSYILDTETTMAVPSDCCYFWSGSASTEYTSWATNVKSNDETSVWSEFKVQSSFPIRLVKDN